MTVSLLPSGETHAVAFTAATVGVASTRTHPGSVHFANCFIA